MTRSPRGHEPIEHTADVGLRVWAPSLEELFAEAAIGLMDVMGSPSRPADRSEHTTLEAPDLDALFVDWLSEALFLFEAREFVTCDADVSVERDPWRVEATLRGADAEAFRQHGPGVKAVTYHGLRIEERRQGWEGRVYLDV